METALLYPRASERLPSHAFKMFLEQDRENKPSTATVKNYGVTGRLIEREFSNFRVEELTQKMLAGLRDKLVEAGGKNSAVEEHFIRLKAVLKQFQEVVDTVLRAMIS